MKKVLLYIVVVFSNFCVAQKQFELYFDFNKDFPNAQSILDFNRWKTSVKVSEVYQLEGYCDSVDTKNYNKKLAERRIESIVKLLKSSSISISKEVVKHAVGKEFEQSENQDKNRKVIVYYNELQPEKPKSVLYEAIKNARVGETIKLSNIYFYNNSARMVPKSEPILYDLLCVMEDNPKLQIEIQGHICCQTVTDVGDVSTARAKAIYNFLIRNKIDRTRMSYKGFGTSRPIHKIPEKNETEADENRRVEIMIVENR
jgi:outer membrane protein OmpA-like peptidoglycan-associated protein